MMLNRFVRATGCGVVFLSIGFGCSGQVPSSTESIGKQAQALTLPGISFQTALGGQFLGAQNNGGALESGDSVFIQAGNGQFFQALNGGGSTLSAASNNQLGWESFKLVKPSGGTVADGDVVGLQAPSGSWVSAQNGGGGTVFAYGGALGSWEQVKIRGVSAPKTAPTPTPPSTEPVTIGGV